VSLEIYAFVSALPARRDWQAAIEQRASICSSTPSSIWPRTGDSLPASSRGRRRASSSTCRPHPRWSATIRLPPRSPGRGRTRSVIGGEETHGLRGQFGIGGLKRGRFEP
jgi:hypothetical protein